MVNILVLCTLSCARTQRAEAFLQRYPGSAAEVRSSGTEPGTLRPLARAVIAEVGCDLSGHTANPVEKYAGRSWDYVITGVRHSPGKMPLPACSAPSAWEFSGPQPVGYRNLLAGTECPRSVGAPVCPELSLP